MVQGSLSDTVEGIGMKIRQEKPDVVYVDGAYLLQSKKNFPARWERIAHVAEHLKKLATDFNIPIFASYQFNRKGAGDMANIGGSDSVGQLASIVLSLTSEDKDGSQQPWSKRSFKHLNLIKGREGEEGKIRVLFDMRRMIIQQDSILEGVSDEESPYSAVP